ncbi:kinesin, putative [Talaromyces stipitatus ATCC 10500]|uniref:Kinesin, putative n=1 Tax=Talaromyces stipitatus (strain ATCC 10500 / CBS 375.48 / QM 6759 / NRRL 1006) TaxID=441959 RepID=B8MCN2_TALSN|nr:kinesin, putative [Talaromyces stipitatus ATCC 10500]EED18934.1 kinesin, putative [Talaromyces stipitatus ATCC 10500]
MVLTHDSYTVAWIYALPLEAAAARVMLDKTHSPLPKPSTDLNAYELGEINGHYIVIAYLPAGVYSTVSTAAVVSHMRSTFPRLQYGLMVGIGGDVVALLTHLSRLEAKQMTKTKNTLYNIVWKTLEQNPKMQERFLPPEQYMDLLFYSSYHHATGKDTYENCDKEQLIKRQPRGIKTPYIHYGLIASGDEVMKDSETRDRLAQQHRILYFKMEAAGIMDELPTLMTRGICDYCDSHKQKQWQGYAALTAATYAKLLLSVIPISFTGSNLVKSNKMRHWVVSLARNPNFVGREDEIIKLEELVTVQDGPRRIAITGLGGVGKTQVALELAYHIQDRDKECSVYWISCTSHAMVEQMFLHIAQKLGLPDVNPAEVKKQVKIYLSSERAGKWLLIFDNADDAGMWLAASHTENFPIPDINKKTALKILEKTLVHKNLLEDTNITATLLKQLAFLPLAIAQASAYILENGIMLSTYLALLQEQEQDAVELLSEDFKDPGRYKDIQNPVITTWLISFQQIQRQDQLAIDYLSFMACIDPRNIPQSLLPQPSSRKQKVDALGLLNAYSFTNGQERDIGIHRLVHIATRNWLRKNALFSHWIQQVAEHMQNVFPDDHHTNRGLWREYLPHALALVRENEFVTQEEDYLNLTEKIADCLTSDGRYREAELLYKKLGRWNEAERLFVQVMETRKTVLGAEHPDTLTSMANLASTYRNQGRWNEAEKLEVQVMDTFKTVLGAKHPDTLISMANLASTYWNQGRWNEAEKLEVQVMEIRKTVLGAEHPSTLISMNNLAYTLKCQGKLQDALTLMEECSHLCSKILGPTHPNSISSSRALSGWMVETSALPDQTPLIGKECPQPLREVSSGSSAAVITTQSGREEHINLPYAQRRLGAKLYLRNHPLIIAARTPSLVPADQELQDVD